jgi:hypothetical protein
MLKDEVLAPIAKGALDLLEGRTQAQGKN